MIIVRISVSLNRVDAFLCRKVYNPVEIGKKKPHFVGTTVHQSCRLWFLDCNTSIRLLNLLRISRARFPKHILLDGKCLECRHWKELRIEFQWNIKFVSYNLLRSR
ncbi:hypothetical protein QQP08_026896 [Theobroma cacao]|nr:hypothetical protein QQP08_026896 [Theobroma cacao]